MAASYKHVEQAEEYLRLAGLVVDINSASHETAVLASLAQAHATVALIRLLADRLPQEEE